MHDGTLSHFLVIWRTHAQQKAINMATRGGRRPPEAYLRTLEQLCSRDYLVYVVSYASRATMEAWFSGRPAAIGLWYPKNDDAILFFTPYQCGEWHVCPRSQRARLDEFARSRECRLGGPVAPAADRNIGVLCRADRGGHHRRERDESHLGLSSRRSALWVIQSLYLGYFLFVCLVLGSFIVTIEHGRPKS